MILELPNLVFETLEAAPTAHDEGIVGSYHSNDIDSLFLEFVVLLKVRRQVVRVAGRLIGRGTFKPSRTSSQENTNRKCTRNGDYHDLLSLPFIGTQGNGCFVKKAVVSKSQRSISFLTISTRKL